MAAQVSESYIREIVETVVTTMLGALSLPGTTVTPDVIEGLVENISESLKAEGIEVVR